MADWWCFVVNPASGMCCEHVRNDGWSGVHSVDMCEGVWNDVCVNGLVCPFSRRNRVLRLHRTRFRRTSPEPSVLNPLSTSDVLKSIVPPFAVRFFFRMPPCPSSLSDFPMQESPPMKPHHAVISILLQHPLQTDWSASTAPEHPHRALCHPPLLSGVGVLLSTRFCVSPLSTASTQQPTCPHALSAPRSVSVTTCLTLAVHVCNAGNSFLVCLFL